MRADRYARWRDGLRGISAAALLSLAACDFSPEARAEQALLSMERHEPNFALLRRFEPQAHARLRNLIEQQLRQPTDRDTFARGLRKIMSDTVTKRLKTAPDQLVLDYARFVADQSQRLEPHPDVCAAILLGTAGDVSEYVPPRVAERERALYRALLTTRPRFDMPMATEAELEVFRADFLAEAQTVLSLSEDQVLDAVDGIGAPLETCRVTGYLMRRISLLPADEAGRLLRLLAEIEGQQEQTGQPSPFV